MFTPPRNYFSPSARARRASWFLTPRLLSRPRSPGADEYYAMRYGNGSLHPPVRDAFRTAYDTAHLERFPQAVAPLGRTPIDFGYFIFARISRAEASATAI